MNINTNIIYYDLLYVIVAAVIVNTVSSVKLPKDFIQCRKSDPNLDECLKGAFQSGIPYLGKGNRNLGLTELDSYVIPLIHLEQKTGQFVVDTKYINITINNLNTTIIHNVHYDPENYNLSVEIRFPTHIIFRGDYEVNGKIINFPINGNGKFKFDFDFWKIDFNIQMKPVARKENAYLEVENVNLVSTIKHLHIMLTNLFNGNKELGDHMNTLLNDNWSAVLNELKPSIEEAYSILIKHFIQQFLNHVPENQILQD